MFSRHLCSYKALLLNDGYTPIGSVCFKSRSDCSKMFIMEHFCSNDSISNIVFIILDNALDLAYCAAQTPPSPFFDNKDTLSQMEEVWTYLVC